jgi:hypothetical protein
MLNERMTSSFERLVEAEVLRCAGLAAALSTMPDPLQTLTQLGPRPAGTVTRRTRGSTRASVRRPAVTSISDANHFMPVYATRYRRPFTLPYGALSRRNGLVLIMIGQARLSCSTVQYASGRREPLLDIHHPPASCNPASGIG